MRLTANCIFLSYTWLYEDPLFLTTAMCNDKLPNDARFDALKNESARQRWQLFHRAIAHAKQSNNAALESMAPENSEGAGEQSGQQNGKGTDGPNGRPEPRLSIAR